ncbi:MAG: 3D domain-containing protein [Candidatus Sulfopaludibacter sp.]|nr:3D domain-containing protein [Candidatus Sulfopaludibacter sp.]
MRHAVFYLALSALLCGYPAQAQPKHHKRRARHPVMVMEATAFARAQQLTASGTIARRGIVAADPRVLPLGTRIRIFGAKSYAGNYLVTDTGADIKGRHIDLYFPSRARAMRFGTKSVRVQILQWGAGKEDAQVKDEASIAQHPR